MTQRSHLSVVPPHGGSRSLAKELTTAAGRVAHYQQQLMERELAPLTVRAYTKEVQKAEWWCEQHGYSLRKVPALTFAQYVQVRPKTHASRTILRSALTHYWAIFKRKDPPLWVLKPPRKPRMVCRALTDDEAHALAAVARERGDRPGLAVLLGMYQGLRREEIASVRWVDITPDGWLKVLGKGDVPATLPLHPVVIEALPKVDRDDRGWLFPGQKGRAHVSPATVWAWVQTLAAEVGLERVTPHRLRHTCLATANDNTGDLRAVQDFARHSKVDTTSGYTRSTERRLHAVVNAVNYDGDKAVDAEAELAALLAAKPGWKFVRTENLEQHSFVVWREAAP